MALHDVIVSKDLERLRWALALHTNIQKGETTTGEDGEIVQYYSSNFRGKTINIYRKNNRFFMEISPEQTLEITPIV